MSRRYSAFGHHFHEISKAELEPRIPSHAKDDDLTVETAAFEKNRLRSGSQLAFFISLPYRQLCSAGTVCTRNPRGLYGQCLGQPVHEQASSDAVVPKGSRTYATGPRRRARPTTAAHSTIPTILPLSTWDRDAPARVTR